MGRFLHVGCGEATQESLQGFSNVHEWQEVRLDINPALHPDILGSITDMPLVETASMDAVFSAHNIEHIYPFEVPRALAEFNRVLKPNGFLVVTCPDLQAVARAVVEDGLTDLLNTSPAGPITALDIFYGHQASIRAGNEFMAHKGGFTRKTLATALSDAGFNTMLANHPGNSLAIWMVAMKDSRDQEACIQVAQTFIPKNT